MEKEQKHDPKEDHLVATEEEKAAEERVLAELGITMDDFPADVLHVARKYAEAEKSMLQTTEDPDKVYEEAYKKYLENYIAKQKEKERQEPPKAEKK